MLRKTIEKRVDARLEETLVEVVTPAVLRAFAEGHTQLASYYQDLRRKHNALIAAYTAAVGTDWHRMAKATKAFMDAWHDPDTPDHTPWQVRDLLKALGEDQRDKPRPYAAPKSG